MDSGRIIIFITIKIIIFITAMKKTISKYFLNTVNPVAHAQDVQRSALDCHYLPVPIIYKLLGWGPVYD